jgi:hypothetical protein
MGSRRNPPFAGRFHLVLLYTFLGLLLSLAASPLSPSHAAQIYPRHTGTAVSGVLNITSFEGNVTHAYAGAPVEFNVSVSGGTLPYSYWYSQLPFGCFSVDRPTFVCTSQYTGTFQVKVTVNDSANTTVSATAPLRLSLYVAPPPVVLSFTVAPATVKVGQETTFTIVVLNGTVPITYLYAGLPAGCATFTAAELTCIPEESGTFVVNCSVSDGINRGASARVTLTVTGGPSPTNTSAHALPIPVVWVAGAGVIVLAGVGAVLLQRRRR